VHHRPYPGTPPTAANGTVLTNTLPGVPDNNKGRGFIGSTEMAYVLFPGWYRQFAPKYTLLESAWGKGSLLRVLPGATLLIRPNMRVYIVGDIEHAYKLPPASPSSASWWTLAGETSFECRQQQNGS